jgi:hypothetical protein
MPNPAVAPVSLEQSLAAYEYIVAEFGHDPVIRPGRIEILGWDLEYVCGAALASFIDQILVRRLNDFIPEKKAPFANDGGLCWIAPIPDHQSGADNLRNPARSSVLFLEDKTILGPPHSLHAHIRDVGAGSFSHWKADLYFSTSDNSDPNTNGHKYTIIFRKPAKPRRTRQRQGAMPDGREIDPG